ESRHVRAKERSAGSYLKQPGVGEQERPVLLRKRREPGLPRRGRVAVTSDLAVGAIGHHVEQLGLARYVTVERHGGDAELVGEPAHGQAAESVPVGELDGRGRDLLPAQAWPWPSAAAPYPPQQLDGAPGVSAAAVLGLHF